MAEKDPVERKARLPWIINILFMIMTLVVGFFYIWNRDHRLEKAVSREIDSVCELKIMEIQHWMSERMGDALVASGGVTLIAFSQAKDPAAVGEPERVAALRRLKNIQEAYGYDRVFLIDRQGKTLMSYPGGGENDSVLETAVRERPPRNGAELFDFYRNREDDFIYLAVLIPVGPSCILAFRVDPSKYLYPYLSLWPTSRETAETVLLRKEGDSIVPVSPLRFREDAILKVRFLLSEKPDLVVSKAARGSWGVVQGLDYRGVPSLASVRPIVGTPWILAARIDVWEESEAAREGRTMFVLLILVILGFESVSAVSVKRKYQVEHHKRNEETARALFKAEETLRKTLESSNEELEKRVAERSKELVEANRRLEASNGELEAFAYSVAHDLRAPLRAIEGFSRILEEDHADALDAEGRRVLDVVLGNVRKMDQLISEILEISRLGRMNLSLQRIDMAEMARDVFSKAGAPQDLESFEFRVGDLPEATADPGMMERVWSNLLSNAVKYSLSSPIRSVEVEGREEDGYAIYTVRDKGAGFDPRYADKLFNLFQRLHSQAEFEGNGLGLAIVKKVVTRHGGQVWADGKPGEGAQFSFSLPLHRS